MEQAQKGLREEMGRMKLLVHQSRNQCAVEVRKRERVIEGLKRHVGEGGRARGGGRVVGVREITIAAGVGGEPNNASTMSVSVGEEGYDLRSETNEFLTGLAKGLSEENENLSALVRRTVGTLRNLSGCEPTTTVQEDGLVIPVEMCYDNLAAEAETVIEHVRNLLTNPSFVPLEEVEVREEEICRLREGWERMESRWREAVQMMDGWRKRMARSGQTVNLEELKMGLLLSPFKEKEDEDAKMQLSMVMEEGEGDTQADIDALDDSAVEPVGRDDFDEELEDSDSSIFEEEPLEELAEELSEQQANQSFSVDVTSSPPGSAPQLSPLRETSGNQAGNPPLEGKGGFTTIFEENTCDLLRLKAPSPQKQKTTSQQHHRSTPKDSQGKLSTPPEDEIPFLKTPNLQQPKSQPRSRSSSPQKASQTTTKFISTPKLRFENGSRLPRPRENALPQQSPLTMASIAAKLAASEREADAARVRAKIKAARMNRIASSTTFAENAEKEATKLMPPPPIRKVEEERVKCVQEGILNMDAIVAEETDGEREKDVNKRKRKATASGRTQGGRANRRRSTLSPWELESLILGGGGVSSPRNGE